MFSHCSSSFLTFSSNTFSVNSTLLFKPFHIYFPRFFIPSCDFLISSTAILKFALIKFPMFFSCFSNSSLNIYPITFMFSSLKKCLLLLFWILWFFFFALGFVLPRYHLPDLPSLQKQLKSVQKFIKKPVDWFSVKINWLISSFEWKAVSNRLQQFNVKIVRKSTRRYNRIQKSTTFHHTQSIVSIEPIVISINASRW